VLDSRYGLITGSISAGGGNDIIRAGSEDDNISGGGGADVIDGGGGHNAVSYQSSVAGVKIDLTTGVAKFGDAAGDKLSHIQDVTGTLVKDTLVGTDDDNALVGVLGKDVLVGNGGNDSFLEYGGGKASISGGDGNDYIQLLTADSATYGFAFSALNKIDGGAGFDTLDVTNSGPVVFKATTLINVERIIVEDGFNYSFTTDDATVAKNKSMEVDASTLTDAHTMNFDGSAETNGKFSLIGGAGTDVFKGGARADQISGGAGADIMTGGGGGDTFIFNGIADSVFATRDKVTDFVAGTDKFDFGLAVTGVDAKITGSVSTDSDLTALLTGHLDADHAVIVKVNAGTLAGSVLLVVDGDGTAGFNVQTDYVVDVTGMTGALATTDFI